MKSLVRTWKNWCRVIKLNAKIMREEDNHARRVIIRIFFSVQKKSGTDNPVGG